MDVPQEIGLRLRAVMKFAVTLEYFSTDSAVSHLVVALLVTMMKTLLIYLLTYLRFWTDLTEKFAVSISYGHVVRDFESEAKTR